MSKLGYIPDPRLRLIRAIPVVVQRRNGEVFLWSRPLEHFGAGRSFGEAAEDFSKSLPSLYWSLKRNQRELGPHLLKQWGFLRQYIEER